MFRGKEELSNSHFEMSLVGSWEYERWTQERGTHRHGRHESLGVLIRVVGSGSKPHKRVKLPSGIKIQMR